MELSEVRILIRIGRRQHVYVFLFVCKLVELVGGASVINRATLSRLNIKRLLTKITFELEKPPILYTIILCLYFSAE